MKHTESLNISRRQALLGAMTPLLTPGVPFALSLGLTTPLTVQAQVTSLNDAINKAGRQRMLSQRMAKAWLALGQGIDARRADKVLGDSMALFDRQLVELKSYAPTPDIRSTYQSLEAAWSDYKAALVGQSPDRSATGLVLGLDSKVLKLAHQGTVQLEQLSGKPVGKLVNVAGRQRMLSQRTAKFYLSQRWGAQVADAPGEMEKARQEFRSALNLLYVAPQATPTIREHLTLAEQQWVFFENALSRLQEPAGAQRRAEEVFSTSENILMVMDKVTGLYAQLG
ncbi:type IV pili methyl-accepting chemotaxis transducer N-terminal domain-containing protein [Aquabacterium lacunae]|nr:type IV pili methyl-accepting chemotaxis transducer N-terminal domain-containing protein [Aquabacterium lacunae]